MLLRLGKNHAHELGVGHQTLSSDHLCLVLQDSAACVELKEFAGDEEVTAGFDNPTEACPVEAAEGDHLPFLDAEVGVSVERPELGRPFEHQDRRHQRAVGHMPARPPRVGWIRQKADNEIVIHVEDRLEHLELEPLLIEGADLFESRNRSVERVVRGIDEECFRHGGREGLVRADCAQIKITRSVVLHKEVGMSALVVDAADGDLPDAERDMLEQGDAVLPGCSEKHGVGSRDRA